MTEYKQVGKIQRMNIGYAGYDEAGIGVAFTLGGGGWGVRTDEWAWGYEPSENAKWTNEDDLIALGKVWRFLKKLMDDAKVKDVRDLVGKPIEATFEEGRLKDWRILTEVT